MRRRRDCDHSRRWRDVERSTPERYEFIPRCPSKSLAGLECPGCGSLRATHHILNVEVRDAWRHNPALILIGLPVIVAVAIDAVASLAVGRRVIVHPGGRFGYVLAIVLVAYVVARNLPGERFDALRPPPIETPAE